MALQLFWLFFTLMALLSLIEAVRRPVDRRWPWFAAGASFASQQFFGLGVATVAATACALGGLWLCNRRSESSNSIRIAVPVFSMIVLAALQALWALKFPFEKAVPSLNDWELMPFLASTLGFASNFVFATIRNLFSAYQPTLSSEQIIQDWPYGAALLLGFAFLVASSFWRSSREPTPCNQGRFVIRVFASVLLLTILALVSIRAWREPSPHGFADYLLGSRYLIPSSFALAGLMIELVIALFASATITLNVIATVILAICTIVGNLNYAVNVYPKVAPRSMISHARVWRSIVVMAGECQKAKLAIPNLPLHELAEFDTWDLKLFEPLLRADLGLPPDAKLEFIEWANFADVGSDQYARDVPSLSDVRRRLGLGGQG